MTDHYTTEQDVTGKVAIWAYPLEENGPNGFGFYGKWKYTLSTGVVWQDAAVKIVEFDVSLRLPGGINLAERALETLEDKKRREQEEHWAKMAEYDQKIQQLRRLTHIPSRQDLEKTHVVIDCEAIEVPAVQPSPSDDDDTPF